MRFLDNSFLGMYRYALLLFCSLISFSILFRNTVFLVSILEMRHYKLSMNSCIRYFFGLFYSILSVFSYKVKQQCR